MLSCKSVKAMTVAWSASSTAPGSVERQTLIMATAWSLTLDRPGGLIFRTLSPTARLGRVLVVAVSSAPP